jgi:DNA-binding response OmpR family regulator
MNKKRVLIVDDDIALSQSVKINLEETGEYEVRVENCSSHAVPTAHEFQPDVVLLDYIMPGLDGGDVCTRFREDPELRQLPVIMMTALVSNSETGETGSIYRNGHIMVAKPIKLNKLTACIDAQIAAATA